MAQPVEFSGGGVGAGAVLAKLFLAFSLLLACGDKIVPIRRVRRGEV